MLLFKDTARTLGKVKECKGMTTQSDVKTSGPSVTETSKRLKVIGKVSEGQGHINFAM